MDAGAVRRTGIGRIGACKDGNVSSFQICHGLLCISSAYFSLRWLGNLPKDRFKFAVSMNWSMAYS